MDQFSVYVNTDDDSRKIYPYFVNVQTELLDALNSRVVIPLTNTKPKQNLPANICPKVTINGEQFYLLTCQITTVASSFLKEKEGSFVINKEVIINAVDFIFSGI
ncbi:MAG: toxin CcdB [Granulosicoccus sp.]|jgi:toxin CcdB